MNMKEIKQLLKPYSLKLTLPRLKVLEIFVSNAKAITYAELLGLTDQVFDRVTVYRTLRSFEELGIIHRIVGVNSSVNYALSITSDANKKEPHQQHLHFGCTNCHSVYCLNDQLVPPITLPDIYEVHSLSMIIVGTCRMCNEKPD
jgi:Fur family transcriptional regulator, ferric uptake regulator